MKDLTKPNELTVKPSFDVFHESQDNSMILMILFGPSKSPNYNMAVSIARGIQNHALVKYQSEIYYALPVTSSREDLTKALALLKLVMGWRTCFVFSPEKDLINSGLAFMTLECLLKHMSGLACSVRAASYKLPCERLLPGFKYRVLGDDETFSYLKSRLQNLAVEEGCNWCPRYDAKAFAKLKKKQA